MLQRSILTPTHGITSSIATWQRRLTRRYSNLCSLKARRAAAQMPPSAYSWLCQSWKRIPPRPFTAQELHHRLLDDMASQGMIRGNWHDYIEVATSLSELQQMVERWLKSLNHKCNRLQLLTKPLSLLYEIGFIDYRSRFHFFEAFLFKVFNRGTE